ncbi:hypothetical protein BDQ12DRAFT_725070 [Crucibulum laeve]|uniref:Uncharacterized protein n=1 Tax=Crucibulum laeve TaxID=68775 RepID=A0A5C3LTT0_9AGAR|nr:hypothetical protein BDQ12DRAFT_725070 [Crucibulum laeve]
MPSDNPLSDDNVSFLHTVPSATIMEFRNAMFTQAYIQKNSLKFLLLDWIDFSEFKEYMEASKNLLEVSTARIASEYDDVKSEPKEVMIDPGVYNKRECEVTVNLKSIRTNTFNENGHETIEILDSDKENVSVDPVNAIEIMEDSNSGGVKLAYLIDLISKLIVLKIDVNLSDLILIQDSDDISGDYLSDLSDESSDSEDNQEESDTIWLDHDVISFIISSGHHKLNRQLTVEQVERVVGIPTYWLVPQDKDQESWTRCTGDGDSDVKFDIFTKMPIECRHSRLECAGVYACKHVNPALVNVTRYELDPASLEQVIAGAFEDWEQEGTCKAHDSDGDPCEGKPVMRAHKQSRIENGKSYFIACTGWKPDFRKHHKEQSIHPQVDEHILARIFAWEASSTALILGTITPALIAPALANTRMQQVILLNKKKKVYTHGTGVPGVTALMADDLNQPLEKHYVHSITTSPSGGLIIFTAHPYLLSLIHETDRFEVDTSFKRVHDSLGLNEWELSIWSKKLQHVVSIARIYSNKADRSHYKLIFDILQQQTHTITGKPLRFKRLSKGGNLLTMGVDLEAAQVLGAGDSFLTTNEPDYSLITTTDPNDLVQYFVCACVTHVKHGIKDFKGLVNEPQYNRLINFIYLKDESEIKDFSNWIMSLGIKKIQDWWDHKVMNTWILPALIQCRLKIHVEDWNVTHGTTNICEAQHHWTNANTGTKHTLLEGIITYAKFTLP